MFTPVAELPFQSAFNYKEGSTTVLNLAGGFNISQHYVSTSRYVNWLCFSCFFGVPLGDIDFQLCVAGVALGDINLHFVWQAWHLWYWAASCVAFQCMFCLVGTCVRSCRARCYSSIVEVILSVRSPRTRSLSTFSVNTRFACQVRVCKIQKVTLCHGLQKFL